MNDCYEKGTLRAYLDEELSDTEQTRIAAHTAACAVCRTNLNTLQVAMHRMEQLFVPPPAPNPQVELKRLQRVIHHHEEQVFTGAFSRSQLIESDHQKRRSVMTITKHVFFSPQRWVTACVALAFVVSFLTLPPLRAFADQVLNTFRMRNVVFLPISEERLEQLATLDIDGAALFLGEPQELTPPTPPQKLDDPLDAADELGFRPSSVPIDGVVQSTSILHNRHKSQFHVNVEMARQALAVLTITDVTLPDALGQQPIVVDIAPMLETRYDAPDYDLILRQTASPEVALPEGVAMAQLGTPLLRVLGMDAEQAAVMSSQIDWNSTFVFPFPQNMQDMRIVTINGVNGLLVGSQTSKHGDHGLLWRQDDRFYMLEISGTLSDLDIIRLAESLQ